MTKMDLNIAKEDFERTVRLYHLPSADATGSLRLDLLKKAAAGYLSVVKRFPQENRWSAQALRSLGNVYVELGQPEEALEAFTQVGVKFCDEDWEVLQAWKSAADLSWSAGRAETARTFDRRIVERFSVSNAPPIIRGIVASVRRRSTAL